MRFVAVGATGAVGTEILSILAERDLPVDELVLVASQRSAGRRVRWRDRTLEVFALEGDVFRGGGIAFFDVPDDVSLRWVPVAAQAGCTVIDKSAAWRMDAEVPLVVPEINPAAARAAPKSIIASPNCTTLAAVVPLHALHVRAGLKKVSAASYQAVSGAGKAGVDELWDQTEIVVKEPDAARAGRAGDVLGPGDAFRHHPIALNVIPQVGSVREGGYTSEEAKFGMETRKIMSLPDLPVSATCVRVPVVRGHGVALHAEFERPLSADEARAVLDEAPGVEVVDDAANGIYPTPLLAAGRDPCYVGRIRQDPFDPRALDFFSVADNLRKGAALNAVQIAALLV